MSEVRTPQHKISAIVGTTHIRDWMTYEIRTDLMTPTDTFTLRIPFRREVWEVCKEDQPIQILIDDVAILTGFIGESYIPENDEAIYLVGRDRIGRLVQESAPGINFAGLSMQALIEKLAAPWFRKVTFSNARNRTVVRGRGRKSKAGSEPLKLFSQKRFGTSIQPGQSRWQVISTLLAQAGLIAWSSGDGTELIVGKPNYDQEPQFRFFMPAHDSRRVAESTVLGLGFRRNTEERYSRIDCVGNGQFASVRNNPATPDGAGLDFSAAKLLTILRSPRSHAEALELAQREMDRRDSQGKAFTARCGGHGQIMSGSTGAPTIFCFDTLASVEDERTGMQGIYLIVSCTYRSAREGEETTMELVQSGSELSIL